jgi:formate hydrogenlyase subunit 4
MQGRVGAPFLQSFLDLRKLLQKSEVVSSTASWIFRSGAAIELCNMILLATMVPWISNKPAGVSSDLFLIVYLFALSRLFAILAALDSGSPFGAFGSSRDATLAVLVEPASLLGLASLGLVAKSTEMNVIFSLSRLSLAHDPGLWFLVGTAIVMASLVELSRMPVDDPATHLELTMIHEAMILESSGRNLALREFTSALKMTVLFGLSVQCYLRTWDDFWQLPVAAQVWLSIAGILALAFVVGVFESVSVKLQWRKVPEFISYCMTISLLAAMVAVARGLVH